MENNGNNPIGFSEPKISVQVFKPGADLRRKDSIHDHGLYFYFFFFE